MSEPLIPPDAAAHCTTLVRERDFDHYIAGLFAPAGHRPALMALRAFAIEVADIPLRVSEPLPGEVRLQWWRDVLEEPGRHGGGASPVAVALTAAIQRYSLPIAPFQAALDARIFDLYHDPMGSMTDLEGYCGETRSSLIRLATLVLADGGDPGPADASGHAGVVEGLLEIIRDDPRHVAEGRAFVPAEVLERHGANRAAALVELADRARRHLAQARAALRGAPAAVKPAFLTLALAEPALAGRTLPAWRRQWLLWRAARKGVAAV